MAAANVSTREHTVCRIVVVDDHAIMRDGLLAMLGNEPDMEIVGAAEDGKLAVHAVDRHEPDLVLIDLSMPRTDGVRAIETIKRRHAGTGIVVLTYHMEDAYIRAALEAGADAYVLKDDSRDELLRAIRSVRSGTRYLSPAICDRVMAGYLQAPGNSSSSANPTWERLTNREREVLKLVAEGNTSPEIAEYLSLSKKTVEKHRANMMRKLGLSGVSAVTAYAIENGLLK